MTPTSTSIPSQAIAVIGMACRFPGAGSVAAFWRNLCEGRLSIRRLDEADLVRAGVAPELRTDPSYVPATGVLDDVDCFDAALFGMSPAEAALTDPQHRVFLECAWSALEAAGYAPGRPLRAGVFAGGGLSSYLIHHLLPRSDIIASLGLLQLLIANKQDFIPSRVAYKLNLSGPAVNANTACSTGLANVHLACQSLLAWECDLALAGGVSVQLPQDRGYLYQPDSILSPDGHCRPFDAQAGGTVSGNGAGVVVLKRLDEAVADGDHVHAVILGTAMNNDGARKAGLSAPSVDGQAEVILQALAAAGVSADSIGFVEAHGTGTAVGDPIELTALTQAYRTQTARRGYCAVGSVKANVGHLDEAAGIAGLIKAVLALEHARIPGTPHFRQANLALQLESSPFRVDSQTRDWPVGDAPRRAGVSSFGLGGTNVHAVLQQAPAWPEAARRDALRSDEPGLQVLVCSARSAEQLQAQCEQLADALDGGVQVTLADVAHTLRTGRTAQPVRCAVVAADVTQAIAGLRGQATLRVAGQAGSEPRPVAFLLPGHGAEHPGMARGLYRSAPVFRRWIDEASRVLAPRLGADLGGLIEGPAAAWRHLSRAQPLLFAIDHALAQQWFAWGVRPAAMLGLSLGELVAATLAGVFRFEDALSLVAARGAGIAQAPAGAMLAVSAPPQQVRQRLPAALALAVASAPTNCVVSGPRQAVVDWAALLAGEGVECRLLDVPNASHHPMLADAAHALESLAGGMVLSPPAIPFISNLTGDWITAQQACDPAYWARHLCGTVQLDAGLATLCRTWPSACLMEVGPGNTLGGVTRRHAARDPSQPVVCSMRHPEQAADDQQVLLQALANLWTHGAAALEPALAPVGRRVPLPGTVFARERHWIDPATPAASAPPAAGAVHLHLPSWRRALPPGEPIVPSVGIAALATPATPAPAGPPRRLACVGGDAALRAALADAARARGDLLVNVPAQADLVLDLRATEHWAPTDAEPGPQRFLALVDLARGLVECGVTRHLVVALRGGLAVAGEDPIDPQVAALVGAVQCIEQEHPALRCSAIDMGTGLGLATTWADRLLAQAEDTGVDRLVAWRGAQRWVRDYLLLENWPAPRLLEGGVYLITGGLGSVGLRVARALAQRVRGARLVLCSRGGSLDPAQAAALVAAGALVQVAHADVADEVSMSRLLADVTERHGALNGVVHAAGDTDPGRIFREMSRIDEEQALSLWRARVGGARVLERLLADHPRCRCVLVSSNAATLGGLGLGAYAAACHALDAVAARNRAAGRPWISSNWDGWPARDGSVEPRRAGIEQYTMDAGSAERVFMAVLGCEAERVVVAGGDLQHRLASWQGSRQGGQRGGQVGVADAASPTESRSAVEPRFDATADEAAVAAAFAAVLGVTPRDSRVDFFALGGDSLLGSRMLARLARDHGLTLPLRSLFEGASVAQIAARLREARSASLAGSRSDASRLAVQVVPATIPRQPPAASHPLSSTQRRLWLLHQFSPDSSAWNVPLHQRLDGALDRVALEAAFRALQERHDILRTRFMGGDRDGEADTGGGQDNGPRQVVDAVPGAAIQWMDLSDLPSDAAQARVDELAQAQARQPFDLARGPLVRALLIRLAPQRHVLLVTAHHIVCDGVSLGVIGRDLSALYRSALEGRQPALPPLPLQYRDFAAWHNAYLESQEGRRDRDFWLQQLAGPLPVLDLVDDLPRPPLRTHAGAEALWRIPPDTTAALGALAARSRASLFMVLLAALNALLHRYSGATDIIVGSPAAGRPHADLEDQVGCYLNTLVLRNPVDPAQGFSGLLTQVAANAAQAYEHQAYPFEELVAQLQAGRDPSRSPVFDVMLILQNDVEDVLQLPGIQALPCFGHNGSSKLDLSFNFKRLDGQLLLGLEYNLDLFTRERIEALSEHLVNLLAAVARDPAQAVGDIPLASSAELARIAAFNRTATDWPAQLTLVDAFEQQAARQPQAMAVRCGPLSLTYEALAGRALAIARRLTGCGVAHGDILVLALDSGPDLLAALLATFRVGAAAVLTERPLPPRRLEAMLAQSGAHALLVDRAADPPLAPVTHIALDAPAPAAVANLPPPPGPEDAALVFFTSGSTGVPRGVPLSHRAIVNELDWFRRFFALGPQDVLPQKTVLTFVDCIVELLLPVTFTGGCSVLRPQYELARDLPALWDWCAAERASLLQLVPVVFDALRAEVDLAAVPSLRTLVLSGAAPPRLPRMPFRIFNLYGCSESTSLSSWYEMTEPVPLARVPIGWPLQNTQLHVLDERMRPCPLFVPGEVYIGGVMLSAGYLGDAAQTAARFVPDPTAAGARLFRTGDLGRRLADGSIDYLGRCDDQVKIRGIRIECGEVEAALRQCPGVQEVVVAAHAPADAETVLVAYLAGHEGELDAGLLRQQLVQQLPPAMLPAAFVQLPALPRTSSGKIDKRALPAPPVAAAAGERVLPRNEFEARIAAIWCEVLQLPDVGICDDFILLGGHSLRAVRVAARLARELQREVGITDILRYPRIDQLAPVLAARPVMAQAGIGAAAPVIAPISPEELDLLK